MTIRKSIEVLYTGWCEGGRKLPWIFEVLFDLPYALDLTDDMGRPDHDKMVPTFVSIALIVFLFIHPVPSWEAMIMMIILGAYVYGYSAWRSVAKSASDILNRRLAKVEAVTENIQQAGLV